MSEHLRERLQELHKLTALTPQFNPVFQLGLELSRDLESGRLSLNDIADLVSHLESETLHDRALLLRNRLAPVDQSANLAAFRALAEAGTDGFADFARRWSSPMLHTVFTGHPTFLLTEAQSEAVAAAIVATDAVVEMPASSGEHAAITLSDEHRQAMAALRSAQSARDSLLKVLFDVAADKWPQSWRDFKPMPFRFATWIGYDMDGRTDLNWSTNLRLRLAEKAMRLRAYATDARALGLNEIADRLTAAAGYSEGMSERFNGDMNNPATLSEAANAFTADDPDKLLSLKPIIDLLEARAGAAEVEEAKGILALAAAMRADGLGMGWIHFRMNSSQLLNAIRIRIDPDNVLDMAGGTAMSLLRDKMQSARPLRCNIAALAIETTTAVRQFMTVAQILRHIDADAPVRLLIAECEEPQTVMAALYFATLFGVEGKIDISPLFETESAMEHGGRFLDSLLAEPLYRDYVRQRGRIAIQTGFSDAGRFVGQIPAALAIERLQGRLARAMEKNGLDRVAALIFNTHGESMGRGGYPGSIADRLTWPMSHWARDQFARRAIATELEASFQGGDGFLYFKTPQIALATLTRIAEAHLAIRAQSDPFYSRTDISLDYYRNIRSVQRAFLVWRAYARSITAFGLSLLPQTGSRKSRRQSDLAAEREMGLRQIRAIPHNAILQQLGYPINVIAGAGTATGEEVELVAEVLNESVRGRQIAGLLRAADRLGSIKSIAAYGDLFSSVYWASRPYRGTEQHLENACLALAERLESDDRAGEFRRLTSRLRVDGMKLHRLLALLPAETDEDSGRETIRRSLGVLHALRIALMQHMFLLAVTVPAFSRSNDISRDDVIAMIFALRIDEAMAQFRRAFPISAPELDDFAVDEPSDYPDQEGQPYSDIRARYIDPIEESYHLVRQISVAIANIFGALG